MRGPLATVEVMVLGGVLLSGTAHAQLALTSADTASGGSAMVASTAQAAEEVVVPRATTSSGIDPVSASIDTRVGADLMGALPLSRSFLGLISLAPGAVDYSLETPGNQAISGSSILENSY